jgi:predicted acetyltransferase
VDYELRPIEADEFPAFSRAVEAAFGHQPTEQELELWRSVTEFDRTLAVFDDGRIVGTAGAFTMDLTLPGRRQIPVAGVTAVSVATSHRRRGLLSSMMTRQLDDVAARAEPVAVLTASESVIYGRFGYGLATSFLTIRVARPHGGFALPLADAGQCRRVEVDEAGIVLPAIFDAYRVQQLGEVSRNDTHWHHRLSDLEPWREGASAYFHIVHDDEEGRPDGYLTYRVRDNWSSAHLPNSVIEIHELVAATSAARQALWRFALSIDLAAAVTAINLPVDDPIRWELADPRRLEVTALADHLWARLLDVPAALAARDYPTAGHLVIEVTDRFRPGGRADGRFELDAGPGGADCRPTDAPADLALAVEDLGALFLGGVRATTLAEAGRVHELQPGALDRADALFVTSRMPFCTTHF